MTKKLILCDCLGSQSLDADAISAATGLGCSRVFTNLCEAQIEDAAKAIAGGDVILACQQERLRFEELAAEIEADTPAFLDLRDRAGWSDDESASAKMAALAAEAALPAPAAKSIDVHSEGLCLIIGAASAALPAAEALCETLGVTVLLTDESDSLAHLTGPQAVWHV